jgi:hypothetical protein
VIARQVKKTLPDGRAVYRRRYSVVPEDGQTEFKLPSPPTDGDVMAQVNTVEYHSPHLRIEGGSVIWANRDFGLDPEDEVAFYYYEERAHG